MAQLSLFKFFHRDRTRSVKRRSIPADSDPKPSIAGLREVWCALRREYFPNRPDVDDYQLRWSSRPQRRTLASCSFERRRVVVARELNYPQYDQWLAPLLYHEMCHAVLGESARSASGRGCWHGAKFRALEKLHPGTPALDYWVRSGGWRTAVISDRSRRSWLRRRRQ